MKKFLFCILIFLASSSTLWAACSWNGNVGTAASGTSTEVQYCVNDASTKVGEVTINIPSGTYSWTNAVTINMSSGFASVTSLRIFGAGTIPSGSTRGAASSGGTTINITTNLTNLFAITTSTAKKFRLANITIGGSTNGASSAHIFVYGNTKYSSGGGFRLDHLTMSVVSSNVSQRAIWVTDAYGVIDHNSYAVNGNIVHTVIPSNANIAWATPVSVGSSDFVFIEDNTATSLKSSWPNIMFCDNENGGRTVIRYNTMTNMYVGGHGFDNSSRGPTWYESYNNTIHITQDSAEARINLRGGSGMHYNNTITSSNSWNLYENAIMIKYHRRMGDYATYLWGAWDYCDSTLRRTCFGPTVTRGTTCTDDANCGGSAGQYNYCQYADGPGGYPCRDQVGVANTHTSSTYSNTYQLAAYPALFWNNTLNGSYVTPMVVESGVGTVIQNNRDYCHHPTTMPATCNGIATTYTAYTYPHPLTGGGGESDSTAPVTYGQFPTTQQACSADPQTVNIGLSTTDLNITTCKWDTSTGAYAALSNTFDGTAAGTVNHTDSASFACGATHTIYYACQDAIGNTTVTASWTFSLPALLDETTPVITNVTSATQSVALIQKLSVTTSVAGSCRYCINGVSGCASDTAWASRTPFSVTGGETTHHEVSITMNASETKTFNVICQNTQGTATSTNSAITITTDAAKSITAGAGSLSITQGSGSLSVTILP